MAISSALHLQLMVCLPRHKAIQQSEFPYNISARCINREWFGLPMADVWNIFADELLAARRDFRLLTHSFVLMSNHFHLIATTPEANISHCMQRFMYKTSRRLTRAGNRINETFAGRHFKCILQHPNYYLNAYKYNYRNPVTAGICLRVEDYPYSTLQGLLGVHNLVMPECHDTTFEFDPNGIINWLNKEPALEKLEGVRYALKRQYFQPKKDTTYNRPLILENDVL